MKNFKKYLTFAALSLTALAASSDPAYPNRTVSIVVPFPAGGGADYLARSLADELQKKLNGNFIVENRPGGSGIIAAEYVKRAKADGYTLLFTPEPIPALNPVVFRSLPYSIKDFAPVGNVFTSRVGLLVSTKNPNIQTFDDLVNYARANPGKLNYASFGMASSPHLAMELFQKLSKSKMTHITYSGAAPAAQAVGAGTVDLTFTGRGSASALLTAGHIRMLAITGDKRLPEAPDVPTFKEIGKGFEEMKFTIPYTGILAPAGTPESIIKKVNLALKDILSDKEWVAKKINPIGTEAAWSSPEEYGKIIAGISNFWKPVVQEAGVQAER